jgi:glycosyltransferase 2 family protein
MIGAHQAANRSRGWILISLRWVGAVAVLGILIHFLPWQSLSEAIRRVPATRFAAILIGYLLAHLVGIAKWRMVVNAAGAGLDFRTSAQCYSGGLFATLFLPSIIGGDVVRLAVGLRRSPNPAAVLAGNLVDRFLDMSAQAGLVSLGIILLPGSLPPPLTPEAKRGILLAGGIVAGVFFFGLVLYRPLLKGRSIAFRRKLARLRSALRMGWQKPHVLVFGWVLGTAIQSTFLVLTALLAISCGLFLPLRVWFFAWPLAKLAALLPLTQGGIGVREAALVGLLSPFGAAAHLVLASGLVWEGVVIVGGLVAGSIAFILSRNETTLKKV